MTAAGKSKPADEPGGTAAAPSRCRGSAQGSGQAEQLCRACTSGRSPASDAAGRVPAAPADRSLFFLCLPRRCLGLRPASGTLPSRGCPSWAGARVLLGLRAGRGRRVQTPGSRRGPAPAPAPALPAPHPFRAGPVRSRAGEASAAAPPASGVPAPRGSGATAVGPGAECGGGGAAASRGATSPRACAVRLFDRL